MKILILTPINPVLNVDVVQEIMRMYGDNEKIDILPFPFFADTEARMKNKKYIPTFFSMILGVKYNEELQQKLMSKKHTIIIGNVYKETVKFDTIVAYNSIGEETNVFDSYLHVLQDPTYTNGQPDPFDIESLYKKEDAEIELPTIHHLKLFMEGVFD